MAVDASGTFSETKRQVGLLRMLQAGVIVSDYTSLMVEILKDSARPRPGRSGQRAWPRPCPWRHNRSLPHVHEEPGRLFVAPGITVDGRIDLIRRLDTGEVAIVDFKSTDRAHPRMSPATNSTFTPSDTRNSPANPPT